MRQPDIASIKAAALAIIRENGGVTDDVVADGAMHRIGTDGKESGTDLAYVLHADGQPVLWFRNHRTDREGTVKILAPGVPPTRAERRARAEEARRRAEDSARDRARIQAEAAVRARSIYKHAGPCVDHPYLRRKRVRPCDGLRSWKGLVVMPLSLPGGEIENIQFINGDGRKLFLKGAAKMGRSFLIPGRNADAPRSTLGVCEGLATGLTVEAVTGFDVLVAVDAGNLAPAAMAARKAWPGRGFVFFADNDATNADGSPRARNVGVEAARDAARAVGGQVCVPPMVDGKKADWNDVLVAVLEGGA